MAQSLLVTFSLAAITATLLMPITIWSLLRFHIVDQPNIRSLHSNATPRGAGIALALSMAFALGVRGENALLAPGLVICAMAVIGALDDVKRLGALKRLALQLLAAGCFAAVLYLMNDVNTAYALFAIFFLVMTINAVNFMDGVNGITALHTILWGSYFSFALVVIGPVIALPISISLLAIGVAYLPWNFPRARVFMGDSGSYLIGAAVGVVVIWGAVSHSVPVVFAFLAPLSIYGTDTLVTLARRLQARETPFEAHKSHIYQQLVAAGWTHTRVALVVTGFSLCGALFGVSILLNLFGSMVPAVVGMVLLMLTYTQLPRIFRQLRPER